MRKLLAAFCLMMLASCIDVVDYNTPYIAEHVITDNKVLGYWRPVLADPERAPLSVQKMRYLVTEKERAYTASLEANVNKRGAGSKNHFWLIKIEDHTYGIETKNHIFFEYKVDEKYLRIFMLNMPKVTAYLEKNHPKEENLFVDKGARWKGAAVTINSFDKKAGKLVLELSRHPELWRENTHYVRDKK